MTSTTASALSGIKVVDLTRHMAGPYGSMTLADFGADVIKVESIGSGDPMRTLGHSQLAGESTMFYQLNRNKRSICVDMRTPQGREIVDRLVDGADVLMENFRPGVAAEIGLGPDELLARNERLVYVSTNAFGSKGPMAGAPGTDVVVQAASGIMSVTGNPDGGAPNLVGTPIADYTSSLITTQAVLLGLAARERTGRGQHIEVSMLHGLLFGHTTRIGPYFLTGEDPVAMGSAHSQVVPYQAFPTADGWAVVGVWGDGWDRFCRAIERPDLEHDERYDTNVKRVARREEVTELISKILAERPTAQWKEAFDANHVLFSPVNKFSDVLEGEQSVANEYVIEIEHPVAGTVRQIAPVVKMSDTPAQMRAASPLLGQHTADVLTELGYGADEVAALLDGGVVRRSDPAVVVG
jgi:crotonobetainyl-CoA:carnitine CoA-transferase CaiB-like acyl-CoA transferase